MAGAWSGLLGYFWGKNATICVFGLDNAGKTTLLGRLAEGVLKSASVTRHPNMYELSLNGLTIKAFDMAGQISKRVLWEQFFPILDGIIFLVDASDSNRLEESKTELHKLLMKNEIANVPILILGNKIDLPSALSESYLREALQVPVTTGKAPRLVTDVRPIEIFMCSMVMSQGYGDGALTSSLALTSSTRLIPLFY